MGISLKSILGGASADPQAVADMGQARNSLTMQQALAGRYGQMADSAGADYGQDNGGYRQAVSGEADYLRADPFTDQRSTEALAGATQGAAQHYLASNSLLTNSLASRGITDGSALAGGLADNAQAYAGRQDAASNALAQQKIATADHNRNALVSLLGGEASQDYGRQAQAMGAEGSLNNSLYGDYSNLGQREQARADQQQNGLMGLIGGVAQAYGAGAFGGAGTLGSFLKKRPKTAPSPTNISWDGGDGFTVGG